MAKRITMRHSCEVTADRLRDHVQNHGARVTPQERQAMETVMDALYRIAREDRERMAAETD